MDDVISKGFAKRLQELMDRKGWNQSVLARRAAIHMPDGKLDRQLIHNYLKGATIPQHDRLEAIAAALGVDVQDLVAPEDVARMEARHSVQMRAATPMYQKVRRSRYLPEGRSAAPAATNAPTNAEINMTSDGEGVHLRIDKTVPFDVALEIMALLKDAQAQ